MTGTADLCDLHPAEVRILRGAWRWFGQVRYLAGPIATLETRGCNAELRELLAQPGRSRVLVIDGGGDPAALLGDNLARKALASGWAGIFINGNVRDCQALAALPLPVLAAGAWPQRSKNQQGGCSAIPLSIGDAVLHPGDWLYADEDGVLLSKRQL